MHFCPMTVGPQDPCASMLGNGFQVLMVCVFPQKLPLWVPRAAVQVFCAMGCPQAGLALLLSGVWGAQEVMLLLVVMDSGVVVTQPSA